LNQEIASLDREIINAQQKLERSDSHVYDLNRRIRQLEQENMSRPSHSSYDDGRLNRLRDELNREYLNRSGAMNFELSNLQSKRTTKTLANTLAIHSLRQEKGRLESELRALERR
jgi:hypothetical protein